MARRRPDRADGAPLDPATERSRRRFARRQWRRRWLTWKPVAAVLGLLALVGGGTWLLLFSSTLAVQGVEVTGAETISAAEVREVAAVPDGEPLATVDLEAVRARVEALAEVAGAEVSRQWPDAVRVQVEERVPVAVVDLGGTLRAMDADGVVFAEYRRAPEGLPRVQATTAIGIEALQESARVVDALPSDLASRVDHVDVESIDRISLSLRDGRTVVWGSAAESEQKAAVLTALLEQDARVYDVSVPGRPTTSQG